MADLVRLAFPPSVIQVSPGKQITGVVEFDYIGPAAPGAIIRFAMYSWTVADAHNEKAFKTVTYPIPDSPDPGIHIKMAPITIQLPSTGLPAGLSYGLLAKVSGIPGKDWVCYIGEKDPPYYQWVVEVLAVEPQVSNLVISSYSKV